MTDKKELNLRLRNIKHEDWIKLAKTLGLEVTHHAKGGSHSSIRLNGYDKSDVRGVVTSLTPDSCTANVNHKIYKKFLSAGFEAEIINAALGIN